MATSSAASSPVAGLGDSARFGEIRSRLMFLIGALVVYRIGTFIPVPGINPAEVARFFNDQSNTIFGVVNMFTGGALSRLSIFAMGVMPYISASIIIQMMGMIIPTFMELRKEGESGRRKLTEYTRYLTVALGAFQSFAAAVALQNNGLTLTTGFHWLFTATVTMTTGTLFLMWLGEQITERGIGNGISMIILAGIVAGLPGAVGNTAGMVNSGEMSGPFALFLIILVVAVTAFVVFVERAQRRIAVNYAKRQVGRRMYAGQTSHIPFKLNMSGVIPPIFASSLLLFPATIAGFFGQNNQNGFGKILQNVATSLGYGQPLH
ncbi:MAG TPA: preprotein translocase subunit SecY, partial [Steroidobacteraceae bacterium]|nr:preprotein translocase subunit SecY [Steroidobacteraceae bacterium]